MADEIVFDEIADETAPYSKSNSTRAILQAIHEEGDEIIEITTKKFLSNRRFNMILFLILFTTSVCIVALTGAVVYLVKDTDVDNETNFLTNKGSSEPLATSSAFSLSSSINSDDNLDSFVEINRVNLVFGEENSADGTTISLVPTGFARVACNTTQFDTCAAKFTVHLFTNDGTVIYHGEEAFLADPSDRLKALISLHQPLASGTQLAEHAHIHLNWWWVWRILFRWVRKQVWKQGRGWVWEQVQESYWGQQQQY